MQHLILHAKNANDLLLIIQLAERLGIAYIQKEEENTSLFKQQDLPLQLQTLAKPLRKVWDLEKIKEEQNYKGLNRKRWDNLIETLDIQESMEELVAQL
ncbi:MAG: hypothetical protein ACKVTZ_01870 [Bacteroidia bacterium]